MLSSLLIRKVVEETASRDYPLEIRGFWEEIGTGVYDILAQPRQRIKWPLGGGTVEFPLAGLLIKRFRKSTSPQMPLDRIPPFYPILHPFWRAPVPYFDRFRSSSKEATKGSVPESTSAALLIRWARLFLPENEIGLANPIERGSHLLCYAFHSPSSGKFCLLYVLRIVDVSLSRDQSNLPIYLDFLRVERANDVFISLQVQASRFSFC